MNPSSKFIVAFVRPHRLDDVMATLQREGIRHLFVSEVKDYGQAGPKEIYRGSEYTVKFRPMVRIEGTVPTAQIERITQLIIQEAEIDRAGGGRVLVFDLDHETPIRIDSELARRQAA
jgi:nitrogen regulatory protein P-II 2